MKDNVKDLYSDEGTTAAFIEQLRNRDHDAWKVIEEWHVPQLARFLRSKFGGISKEDREDVVQESLLAISEDFARYQYMGPGSLSAWLRRVALNKATAVTRKTKTRSKHLVPRASELADGSLEIDRDAHRRSCEKELLRKLKENTPPREWEIFTALAKGASYKDLAEQYNKTEGAIKEIIHRARVKQRELRDRFRDVMDL